MKMKEDPDHGMNRWSRRGRVDDQPVAKGLRHSGMMGIDTHRVSKCRVGDRVDPGGDRAASKIHAPLSSGAGVVTQR